MNRKELLRLLLNQAQFNGFEFRNWFQANMQVSWPGTEQALNLLASESRYYALLFSHDFARSYWRTGARISFLVPSITYPAGQPARRGSASHKKTLHPAHHQARRVEISPAPDGWQQKIP